MLNIEKNTEEKNLELKLTGRLDTTTAPDLEKEIKESIDGIEKLTIDFTSLLSAQKTMNKQGSMVVRNASDEVKEIFEVTGFADILTVE